MTWSSGKASGAGWTADGLVIPAGQTSVQFSLDVLGDTSPEPDERLRIVASRLQGAEITRDWARGWILDDDSGSAPQLVLGTAAKAEGQAGTSTLPVPVTLATASSHPVGFRLVAAIRGGPAVVARVIALFVIDRGGLVAVPVRGAGDGGGIAGAAGPP